MEIKKMLVFSFMFMLAGLAGLFIGKLDKDPPQVNQKVKKVVVHDTVYVNQSFETYNLPKCEGALIDSLIINKRVVNTAGVPENSKPLIEAFGVGYPIYTKRNIGIGTEVGIGHWGTTFDNPQYYSVGCHGTVTPSKIKDHISCSGEWVVLIKEGD